MKNLLFFVLLLPCAANAYTIHNGMIGKHKIPEGWSIKCSQTSHYYFSERMVDVTEFKKIYTKNALNKIQKIYFCHKLTLSRWGTQSNWARGTYDWKKGYIFVKIDNNNDVEYILHHEYSSILMKKYDVGFKSKWSFFNKGKYHGDYGKNNNYNKQHLKQIQKRGWYRDYSQSSFENDFNIIVGHYFSSWLKRDLLKSANRNWRINGKLKLIKEWYKTKGLLK
tara:strand:- start:276 stop:944 length:669 start_codon:yes stop_codon:yes gene_type:complete